MCFYSEANQAILRRHLARYPAMQAVDVYKLAHQASLGAEHAVSDAERARSRLRSEMDRLGDGPNEPLIDSISAGGAIVRVHLRLLSLVDDGTRPVLEAFVRTATSWAGSENDLAGWLECSLLAARVSSSSLDADRLEDLWTRMVDLGYPAAHHSSEFRTKYRPAYRVVASRFLPESWLALTRADW